MIKMIDEKIKKVIEIFQFSKSLNPTIFKKLKSFNFQKTKIFQFSKSFNLSIFKKFKSFNFPNTKIFRFSKS